MQRVVCVTFNTAFMTATPKGKRTPGRLSMLTSTPGTALILALGGLVFVSRLRRR